MRHHFGLCRALPHSYHDSTPTAWLGSSALTGRVSSSVLFPSGNTLGTVIANSILLHLFDKQRANTFFNTLRIVEDDHYQAGLRQELVAYVTQVNGASVFDLSHDLPFYDRYAYKVRPRPSPLPCLPWRTAWWW